ncbi:nitrile hydratase accessory protein [Pseudopelagicola sp. nBUS_19]|uniref:nitrile hydratase accessory protein n=1 Tax=Pseudopelagicola sp. nBUS_19 TaxID=3395316 RepID=UPI003EBF6696
MIEQREPVFEVPWHAQVFALTVHLNEAKYFAWQEWVEVFSANLARHGLNKDLNGGDDYFLAWLETLESLLNDLGLAENYEVELTRCAWENAYRLTKHGSPVRLKLF